MRRINRRTAIAAGLAAAGAGILASNGGLGSLPAAAGQVISPTEFFSLQQIKYYGGYPTSQIPISLRTPNTDGSCVHLATGCCLLQLGEYELAKDWVDSYSHGEFSSRHLRRMESKGLLFAVEVDGDPKFVDFWAGHTDVVAKRIMGVSYNTRHVLNLVDIDPPSPTAKAYLLNNQRSSGAWAWNSPIAAEVSRESFLSNWNRNGGWGFVILGTNAQGVVHPVPPMPV